jgi:glycosyltransferase involved in cell wall biosynthesis
MSISKLKVAIVCDWLTTSGGAEKVILSLHKLFPNAPIYTSIFNSENNPAFFNADIRTSILQKMPFAKKKHQLYLTWMPKVFENFNLDDYDVVISSSHSCAKGIITKPSTLHICYCHSPMRYAWENSINYINEYQINPIAKKLAPWLMHKIRIWDRIAADRVDFFVANSKHVQQRINKYYKKDSEVIYPFVDIDKFSVGQHKEDYYMAVGRLTPYKKFDLIVEAFNKLGKKIKIVGTGVSEENLKRIAKPNIEFLGYVSDKELETHYQNAKALIFPQIEDFGIIPLEAMATGCPVIAYGRGGALETVIDKKTGIFFDEQSADAIAEAVLKAEKIKFDPIAIKNHANGFSENIFQQKMLDFIKEKWQIWKDEMV